MQINLLCAFAFSIHLWRCNWPIMHVSHFLIIRVLSTYFCYLFYSFFPFSPVIFFSLSIAILVRGFLKLRAASKCQRSWVKHMQHVLQFITTHFLPWHYKVNYVLHSKKWSGLPCLCMDTLKSTLAGWSLRGYNNSRRLYC